MNLTSNNIKSDAPDKAHSVWDRPPWRDLICTASLLLLFLLGVGTCNAQEYYDDQASVGTGSMLVKSPEGGYVGLARLNTDYQLSVSGMVVQAQVIQHFSNDTEGWVEAQYVFPLPANSAVNGLRIKIGERIIEGVVKEKERARALFVKARQQGKRAGLVEQQRPNLFTTRVTNIAPGETIAIELTYLETLTYEGGRFSFNLPMTITPRYIPGDIAVEPAQTLVEGNGWAFATTQVPDAAFITPPQQHVVATASLQHQQATVNISLATGFQVASFDSPLHAISVKKEMGNLGEVYRITLQNKTVMMNRDFSLQWAPVSTAQPTAAFFNENRHEQSAEGSYHGLLMLMPPQVVQTLNKTARELVLIVDTSGSMAGTSIILKTAVKPAKHLN